MNETRADTNQSIGYALLLHVLLFALALLGSWSTSNAVSGAPTGTAIKADLVGPDALTEAMRRAIRSPAQMQNTQIPPPQPMRAPSSEVAQVDPQPVAQEPIPAPATVSSEPFERDAEVSALDGATANTSLQHGNYGEDADLLARYRAAMQEAIRRNWTRPSWVPLGQHCKVVINQIPGGEVISVEVDSSCPFDELARRSLEAAVLTVQPLPYFGFESVFQLALTLDFEAEAP